MLIVILLSLASLAATWGGFEGSRWNSEQTDFYNQSAAARTESTRLDVVANQFELIDLELFNAYASAVGSGNTELADFHRQRFRDDYIPAYTAWSALDPLNNPDATSSPFIMLEYRLPEQIDSEAAAERSAELFQQGTVAGEIGDSYILTTVFLGISLFFLGISSQIDFRPARLTLIALGAGVLAFSVFRLASFPAA